jgi:hypothetical protein
VIQTNNPFPQFFDADGDPLDNGKVYFGQPNLDPRTNPVAVFRDYAGTIAQAQPVRTTNGYLVNGSTPIGVFTAGNHSIAVYTANDVLLWSAPDSSQYNIEVRSNGAALSSLAGPTGASLIGFKSAAEGSVPRTVQSALNASVSVLDFGADPTGAAYSTAAFNAAIAYANARGGVDAAGITGTTIYIPDGRYKLGSLNVISKSGCNFVGSSENGAVLLCDPNTTTFTFGDGANTCVGGGVSNVKVEYSSAPGGAVFLKYDYAFRMRNENLLLVNIGQLASLGVSSARVAGGITFTGLNGYCNNGGQALFDLRFGAGLFITDAHVFVGGVGNPTHPASMTTALGTNVFRCQTGNWDTVQVSSAIFERFDAGLSIVAAFGMVYQNFYFANTIFDYLKRWCVYAESQPGGVVAGIRFDNTSWFVSWETDAISLQGAGYHDNHSFGGKVVIAGGAGVNYALQYARNVSFTGLQANACNRLGTVNAAMIFAPLAKGFTVSGCKGNVDTASIGLPWRAPYGIQTGADADRYVISDNAFEGSVAGYNIIANTTTSTYRRCHNNLNANYAGSVPLSMPASTVRVTNTTPFVWGLDFLGGTLTGGYDKNLVGLPGSLPYLHLRLDPGDSFACGYSAAPNVIRFIEQ